MNDEELRAALEARLRFERAMGVECVRPVRPARTTPAPAAPAGPAASSGSPAAVPPRPGLLAPASAPSAMLWKGGRVPAPPPSAPTPAPPAKTAPVEAGSDLFLKSDADALAALAPEELENRWRHLEARAQACLKCRLHEGRTKVVFGEGDLRARLVFVGEGPGYEEDQSGRPFVGRAGQLLDKIISAMGLARPAVYICNVVKCRPPENRTPAPEEAAACWPYLEEQLMLLRPKVIVALGSPAAKTLLRTSEGITSLRGQWREWRGIRVMPTYHPAFVLRQYTPTVRGQVWEDMRKVAEYLKESG